MLPGYAKIAPRQSSDANRLGLAPAGRGATIRAMSDESHAAVPLAIETVVSRLGELEIVFGPQAKNVIGAVRAKLLAATAARDAGDQEGAVRQIGEAMDRLAALADGLDTAEALLMRAVAAQFRAALLRRNTAEARQTADVMFEQSGARWKKRE
jgi:hypothetical protein